MGEPDLNPDMFRAYDIRGVVGRDLTPAVVERLGLAYATFLRRTSPAPRVVVGRDNRPSSLEFRDALIRGIRAAGVSVIDVGLTPSPVMYYAAILWKADGGVNVTGSHNPPQDNGLKLLEGAGLPLAPDAIQAVRQIAERGEFDHGHGDLEEREILPDYLNFLEQRFALRQPLHVVVDPGNAVATLTGPPALERIGCRVDGINLQLDGTFPAHLPDPQDGATMVELIQQVRERGADFGIAWDGDGDRLGVVDERGVRWTPDEILAVFARDVLTRHPGTRILVDVKVSLTAIDEIRRCGGVPVFGPTGHSLAKRKMRAEGLLFGGEGSAHYFFGEDYYGLDDAVFGACALARIAARSAQPFSVQLDGLHSYFTSPELKLPCPDEAKFGVAQAIGARYRDRYPVLDVDGARIDFGDGWALVRASNTGPVLSIRFEAQSAPAYERIREEIVTALSEHPELTVPPTFGLL